MNVLRLAAFLAAATLAACSAPCTHCPNVAGTYTETLSPVNQNSSSCFTLQPNGSGDVTVEQPDGGSAITITDPGALVVYSGTLNEDTSVTLGGVPWMTGNNVSGTLGLSGKFAVSGGVANSFAGTYSFTPSESSYCGGSFGTNWTK